MLKRPIYNTAAQVVGKAITVGISLITTGFLTRKLGANVYGEFVLITSIFIFLDSLADFGTKVIGVKEASGRECEERQKYYVQITWLRLLTTTVAFLLGLGLIVWWQGFSEIRTEAVVALAMIWFTTLAGSIEIIFQTRLRMDLKVVGDVIFPLLFLLSLFMVDENQVTLIWVFAMYLVARVISLGVGIYLAKELGEIGEIVLPKKEIVLKIFKESWPMGLYLLVFASYDRAVDSMMIQNFVGVKEVAFYGLAYKMYATLLQPAYYLVSSVFPMLSSPMKEKRELFYKTAGLLLGGLIVGIPLIYVLAPWMVQILAGDGYETTVTVLRILLGAMVFSYLGHLIGFSLISKGGQKTMLQVGLFVLVFNFVLNLILIPRYGIYGAAGVTVATEAFSLGFMSLKLWTATNKR